MKRTSVRGLLATATAVAAMAIAGCENPYLRPNQAMELPPQVNMTDGWLKNDLWVYKPIPERTGAGQLKVTVPLKNNTDHLIRYDYQYTFTDKSGVAMENASNWQAGTLEPRASGQVSFTSMVAAEDFRLQFRPGNQ
jgi:uncharacterized protein YcfL